MLAKLGGNENPTVDDIKKIVESVGIEFDQKKAEELVEKLGGKDINEIINEGKSKLSIVSTGHAPQHDQQQTPNEEKEESKEEEETLELGGGLEDLFS